MERADELTTDPRLIRVPDDREQWDGLLEVAEGVVRAADLVVLPTDTVYGVACDPFNRTAVDVLFAAKSRGRELPLPILVHGWRQAAAFVEEVDSRARALIAEWWPGPLTIVFRQLSGVGWDLGRAQGTVAVRMPKQQFTLALLRRTGPLAVTSANRSGSPTPRTVEEIMGQLDVGVGVYFDAGEATGGPASTIVDLSGPATRVLRTGAVTAAEIERVLDETVEVTGA
jgi:L-threonylcarbamoyladenylate synthase